MLKDFADTVERKLVFTAMKVNEAKITPTAS